MPTSVATLDAIYPISALAKRQGEVKEAARKGLVRITEQGAGAFVFCSEEQFERVLSRAQEEALMEAQIAQAIEEGRRDKESGRIRTDNDEFFASARTGLAS